MKWYSNTAVIWILSTLLLLVFMGDNVVLFSALIAAILGRLISLFSLEKTTLLILFSTLPFSLDWVVVGNSKMALPAEIIVLVLFFTFIFKVMAVPTVKWLKLIQTIKEYSVMIATVFFMCVLIMSALFSTMPFVSFKFVLVNVLFVSVGLGFSLLVLIEQKIKLREVLISVVIGLSLNGIYTLSRMFWLGWGRQVASALPKPFYNDHTHLAATMLLIIPIVWYLWKTELNGNFKRVYFGALFIFIAVLLLTYSRATWLGAIVMLMVVMIKYYKVKKQVLFVLAAVSVLVMIVQRSAIESYFQINRNDSNSSESGVGEQIKSVTNITSDVSNLERINRWKCAIRMGLQKPVFGYGPGTYQFQYLPFQRKNELTRISVKSPFYIKEGRGGTAHSEYLLSFSESGFLGLFSWFFLIGSVIYTYLTITTKVKNEQHSMLLNAVFLGLIGFFVHAFFNNFLNTPNFALYFWLLMGILVYLAHIYQPKISNN